VCHQYDANCVNTIGGYNCDCKPGFWGDGSYCVDHNECNEGTHNCDADNVICENTYGSFICPCAFGFVDMPPTFDCNGKIRNNLKL